MSIQTEYLLKIPLEVESDSRFSRAVHHWGRDDAVAEYHLARLETGSDDAALTRMIRVIWREKSKTNGKIIDSFDAINSLAANDFCEDDIINRLDRELEIDRQSQIAVSAIRRSRLSSQSRRVICRFLEGHGHATTIDEIATENGLTIDATRGIFVRAAASARAALAQQEEGARWAV